jgi:RNA recognition motif-containing protein
MNPTPPPPNHPMATVCIANFPNETSEADIRDLFSEYGSIHQVKLFTAEPHLKLQSYGYFDLSSSTVARAVAELNGHLFNGSIIRVGQVSHRSPARDVPQDCPAGLIRHTEDATSPIRFGVRYEVATVEKAVVPEGGLGGDWHRYVLSCGLSQITGLHRGTLEEVTEYAASCVELVNSRGATGKTTRTSAYSKKKS